MTPPPRANPSTLLARSVLDDLVAAGVTEVVLAPGSRNAPLAFAAWDAARDGRIRLHTRLDERTAGFLALGMAKVGAPAAVMCTSGTAVANLHPAVLEAAHAGVSLVVVTADRPASVRGTGASQTTDQVRIFGEAASFVDLAGPDDLDAAREALGELRSAAGPRASRHGGRPVHLNVQFTPPLVPDAPWHRTAPADPSSADASTRPKPDRPDPETLPLGPRTVVVAGDDAGPPARVLAENADWPLLAEPSSGSRNGTHALRCYRLLLDGELGGRIERVVVAGHPTLSRPVTRLLEREDVEVVSVRARGWWARRPFPVDREVAALTTQGKDDPAWLEEWRAADARVSRDLDRLLAEQPGPTPYDVARAVSAAVPPSGLLLIGASSPIRDLDLMARPYTVGERRRIVANRGLAGIDGTISTAIGAALARPHGERNLVLMGDVTFLHDANALVIGPDEARPDLTIVVVNDDGGSIFAMLEQGDDRFADRYDKLFGTPHGVDVASLCAATRTPHWKVGSLPELEQALAGPNGGIEVVEVACRRDNRRALDERIRALR
ncbi:2-succinyl-5-enolpyruvyl-6-hydroxy-3-cyclohexene-1-carboxylic-acid synthase [Nocardioides sp. Root140]|uniref:2-succinyl-5-enolpyruvyl-6-hydroxy-3- cyclohexene-1-carboxylic-acid synthase n=1 Tax=Nocardioides sp. Root140 TaxID=1736460 RepID=UPI0006F284BE|nr:2-succinyl-5-enolpyruvyl-6-hydroxy-3-cyclohexene-1-carboxylic-acid synthase [Nocardioides sp. Root140]KQY50162.1 2-succinyl-5-enolpyruvyl-6-hydroxy-3-cyclohexene-1-carboxylate synthase [Nocardioides sp. Root140]